MKTIVEAKKHLRDCYRFEEGFVGVGIGLHENADVLRVYVEGEDFPITQQLKSDATYEGFLVIVEVTGKIQAVSG